MNKIYKVNNEFELVLDNGESVICKRWYEKKTDKFYCKIPKEYVEICGREYISESKFVDNYFEFETTKKVHREIGGWKSKMTPEEKETVERCEKIIEDIKNECMKRVSLRKKSLDEMTLDELMELYEEKKRKLEELKQMSKGE